jgi:FMN-dependent oxidoreductase (nitrilotriacetate monooxygenase family)
MLCALVVRLQVCGLHRSTFREGRSEMTRKKQMKLAAFFHPTGHHVAAWMHPGAQIDAGTNFKHYVQLAQIAERAKFDFIFLADSLAIWDGPPSVIQRWPKYAAYFEPLTLLSGLAAVTSNIGLVATTSTSYNEPFNVARRYASLELISGGRSGWNVVTSANEAEPANFGQTNLLSHAERYKRGREFYDVVTGLWDTWEPDAFVRDRQSEIYLDPSKLHTLNHKGQYYTVSGPLHVGPSPQGRPVIVLATGSTDGLDLAGDIAEVVFTHQLEIKSSQKFYSDLKGRAAARGRSPDSVNLMPGFSPIIGSSLQEAQDKFAFLQSKIHPEVGRSLLSVALGGFDTSDLPLDEPPPKELDDFVTETSVSTLERLVRDARQRNLTVRQMYEEYAGARGQRIVLGTPEMIADQMEEWFTSEATDGFLVQPAVLPEGLTEFVELVMPELVRRGLFRSEYTGKTLRENLGLNVPVNRYLAR